MSNKKVEQYKKEKYNRKKIETKKKIEKVGGIIAAVIITVAILGFIGTSIFYDYFWEKTIADIDASNLYQAAGSVMMADTSTPTPEPETSANPDASANPDSSKAPESTAKASSEPDKSAEPTKAASATPAPTASAKAE